MEQHRIFGLLQHSPEEGIRAILDQYGGLMYAVAINVLKNPQDAEDCVSESLVKLWKKRRELKNAGSLRNYICSVTRNSAIDMLRSRRKADALFEELTELLPVSDQAAEKLEEQVIRSQIKALGEPTATIFLRRYWSCETVDEIAAALHLTHGAVESRLHRGKQRLKELLREGGYFE